MNKSLELLNELKLVFSGRGSRWLDSLLPLLIFLVLIPITSVETAIYTGAAIAASFILFRILKRDALVYALGGLGSVLLAGVFVQLSGTAAGFVLPGLISGAITIVLCVVSVLFNRPLVAWTSFIARRWPRGWYWHPKVLPAYNEVTIGWGVLFSIRLVLKFWFYQQGAVSVLSWLEVILGWPFTIAMLIGSYLYGRWRLVQLKGPSVEEFQSESAPPWDGQQRGF
jgi:hypothetical protein